MTIRGVTVVEKGRALDIAATDGRRLRLPAIWLRDNAQDAATRHPGNGQRLLTILDLPEDVRVSEARLEAGAIEVRFAPDGHVTRFDADWLLAHGAPPAARLPGWLPEGIDLWGREIADRLPMASWPAVAEERRALASWLRAVARLGVALLTGLPCEPGALLRVVARFGFVRETNYGRWFDVRAELAPSNLAYTGLGLQVHTDNPYRDPVPGLQLLHCLESSTEGGETIVVDGHAAALRLRERDPDAFRLLAATPVPFRYAAGDTVLEARAPLIGLAADGELREIRFNNRSLGVPRPAETLIEPWYKAYRAFALELESFELEVRLKLAPGELLIVDNRRVLHGRTAFSGSGSRHLQGCYADRDGLLSTLAALERRLAQVATDA
jgi:gamma-butyrobetaine dioxygenase